MAAAPAHPGLVLGVARFYHDPRGSMRGVLDSAPSDARLLAYGVIAAAFLLAGRLAELLAGTGADLMARAMEQTVSILFFVPLMYFGLAALGTLLARAFGGQGSWTEGRAAFFWAALAAAPVMLLAKLGAIALAPAGPMAAGAAEQAGAVFFGFALACCYAEAFGFRSTLRVFAAVALPVLAAIGLALALGATG